MQPYKLKLELLSPALVGSGQGFGAVIDTDIVFDEVGIPFIPAKRIKGCLLDAFKEVEKMCGISEIFDIQCKDIFGKTGSEKSAPVYFSNLFIENYETNKVWLQYYLSNKKYNSILSTDSILETFTEIRQQTAIDKDGVASEHSLRTSRVVQKGFVFFGDMHIENPSSEILDAIALACMNFRHFGTQRNRGFGEVRCSLLDNKKEISIQKRLEALCIN